MTMGSVVDEVCVAEAGRRHQRRYVKGGALLRFVDYKKSSLVHSRMYLLEQLNGI